MKTKLFLAAMAAVAVIGCQKEPAGSISAPDGDASFLEVDLRAAGTLTRAGEGTYEYGLDDENAVTSIHFYFFDNSGNAYAVDGATNNYVVAQTGVNWTKPGETTNVEAISNAVLVIKQSKQAPPAKMVVVLNAPTFEVDDLAGLHQAIDYYSTENGFVMSNSVYFDGSAIVDATSIMSENIFAANNFTDVNGNEIPVGSVIPNTQVKVDGNVITVDPVEVYVERVAAKVRVSSGTEAPLSKIPVMKNATEQAKFGDKPVYAKVLGWQVTNNTAQAPLLKNIDASWTDATLGFAWNAPSNFRSYWAATTDEPKHNLTFNDLMNHNPEYDYYFENTAAYSAAGNATDVNNAAGSTNSFDNAAGTSANQASQLLIAAQLVDADNNPLQIAKWYGVQYTIDDLMDAMVATVASKIYVKESENTYVTITKDDVDFYQVAQNAADNRYEVRVRAKSGVTYYDSSAQPYAAAADLLAGIDPAQMWNDGHTYYYTTIKHFGRENTPGEYGIVRNHVYDIKIDGITGFGTPVYKEDQIITPEKPEEDVALNLSARINILSWHLVSQKVTLN